MSKYKVCVEQYHDLAASLLHTGGGEGREEDFFMAIERGDVEGVKCILSSVQPLDIKSWVNMKKGDESRDTPLIISATRGYPELVKLFIQMGADPTVTNAKNQTSLHVTRPNCRELILKSATRTPSKTTALITSSWLGNKFTVEDILKRGQVDVNTRNFDYFTPLLLVTRDLEIFDKISLSDDVDYEPVLVAAELIKYNTNVMKACDDLGRNAVHLAAGHTGPTAQKLVDLLLNNCMEDELESKDSRANTPLHYATQSGDREIVANLIKHGANPNAVGERGYTPLHISATKGTVELAGFLLGNGADIRIVDDAGDSAYQLANTEGMRKKLKEAWTEATQLERTDSEVTLTNSCLLDQTGIRGPGGQEYMYPYQREGPLTPPTHHRGVAIGSNAYQANTRQYVNELGITVPVTNMKPTNTRTHNNTAYNIATGVTTDIEEGLDQLSGLPNQLLASKGMRISGASMSESTNSYLSSLQSQRNVQNLQSDNNRRKTRKISKRKVLKPPTEDKLKALAMPKYPRVVKDQTVQAAKVSDNIIGVNQTKRSLLPQTQDDNNNNEYNNNNIISQNDSNIQAVASKQNQNINKQTTDTQVNNTTEVNTKSKTTNLRNVRKTKSSVFDRLHKTPIRNMKANAKSDVNLLTQIHEDTENNMGDTRPVVVNFGGIKGLGIAGNVAIGQKQDNNPLRFFLLDINQVPEKRRHENMVYKPTGQSTISSKPAVRTDAANVVQPIQLAVVAQNFNKAPQDLQLHLQTRKQTQSDSVVYDLKTPAQELAVVELKRFNTTQQSADEDTQSDQEKEDSTENEELYDPPEEFERTPTHQSPEPERPCTPIPSHTSLPPTHQSLEPERPCTPIPSHTSLPPTHQSPEPEIPCTPIPSHTSLPPVPQSPQLVRSRAASFIETSASLSGPLRKNSLQETESPFLPQISPGRSISNPEKHSSLRQRSKSSDCISLSKSLTAINLNSDATAEVDDPIFRRCTPLTYKPSSPSALSRSTYKPSSPSAVPRSTYKEEDTSKYSPQIRRISSPYKTPTRPSIIQKPLLASIELGQVSPSLDPAIRRSLPSITRGTLQPLPSEKEPHKCMGSLKDEDIPLCPSLPEIEREAVNSEEIVSVLGKPKSRISQKRISPSIPSQASGNSSDKESDYDSDDDATEVIRWKKGAVLGTGAYGTVVRGLTLDKGMIIAVKQIELNHFDRDKAMKQYNLVKAEVDVLKRLNHGNIVKYLGSCLDNMTVNIFMEFVAGGSVGKLLKTFGPFEESFLRNYTRQIVVGIKYLHSKTVIHRDVKGDNIMVEPSGCIKLIDFGCARAFRDESATLTYDKFTMLCKSMKGTVYWMAPEVIREEEYNEKADIWSIGCTVFEMASGKPPWAFKELSQEAALFRIGMGYDLPEHPDTISEGVKEFINRCLQQDPTQRPSAKQLLQTQFLKEL